MRTIPRVPDLIGRLRLDTSDLTKAEAKVKAFAASTSGGLGKLDQSLGRLESTFGRAGDNLTDFGKRASVVATLPIAAGFAFATKAASDLGEQTNKVSVVFGENADEILRFTDNAAKGLGQSQRAALESAGTFGNLFRAIDLSSSKSADMSKALLSLTADLASFNNANPEDVFLALRAGLVGETEPLRKFGVNLTDARLRVEALNLGLSDGKSVLGANAKAQAAFSLIMKDTALAQGDFERTSGALANQTRILRAEWEDSAAELGANLIPAALKMVRVTSDLLSGFAGLPDSAQNFVLISGAAIAAVGPLSFLAGNVLKVRAALDLMTAAAGRQSFGLGVAAASGARMAGVLGKIGIVGLGLSAVTVAIDAIKGSADDAAASVERLAMATEQDLVDAFRAAVSERESAEAAMKALPFPTVEKPTQDADLFARILEKSVTEAQRFVDALDAAGIATGDFQERIDKSIETGAKASIVREKDADAVKKVADALRAATGSTDENTSSVFENADAWLKAGDATDEMRKKIEDALGASEELIEAEFAQADALDRFSDASRNVVEAEDELREARKRRGDATRDAISIERALNAVEDAQTSVLDKEKELAKAREGRGSGAREIIDATRALKDAQQEYNEAASQGAGRDKERAAEGLADAQQRLADAEAEGGREGDIAKATEALSRAQLDARDAALSLSEAREQAAGREAAAVERIRSAEDALSRARRTAVSESVALATATRALVVLQGESVGRTADGEARYRLLRDELVRVKDAVAPGSELHSALLGIIDTLPPPEVKFKVIAEVAEAMESLALIAQVQEALGVKLPFGLDFSKNKKFHTGGLALGPPGAEIPAVLRSGEFVIRDAMVRRLGVDFLARLNAGGLPRFHEGGLVPNLTVPELRVPQWAGGGGNVDNRTDNRTTNYTIENPDPFIVVNEVERRQKWMLR